MIEQIVFIVTAAVIISSALMVVTSRNLIHMALWLIATLFGVAILFANLDASFLAVAQVVIYIGAIAIMFIFAVMLTRRDLLDNVSQTNKNWPVVLLIALITFGGLFAIVREMHNFNAQKGVMIGDPLTNLANALVSPNAYVLPFEVASVLLLAALIGSVYVAYRK